MQAVLVSYKLQRNLSHFVTYNEVDIFTVAMHLLLGLQCLDSNYITTQT